MFLIKYIYGEFLILLSILMFMKFYKHILMTLISFEFMVVSIYMYIFLHSFSILQSYMLFFLLICICEGVLGLSLLIMMIHFYGNEKFKIMNLLI